MDGTRQLTKRGLGRVAPALAGAVLLLAACGGSNGSPPPAPVPANSVNLPAPGSGSSSAASAAVTVKAAKTSLGTILVDAKGMTLYRYTADKNDKSNCTWSGCTALWPPLPASGTPKAGPGVSGRLGVITGPNGKKQVTFDGWPLYTYVADKKPGQTTGQKVKDAHGVWYVVFAQASKNPAPPGSASGSASGSGSTKTAVAPTGPVTVKAAKTSLGTILVDAKGMTLYRYSADATDKSNCTWSGCTALWPPLPAQGTPRAGPGVSGKLGVITGPNGKKQVTFDGWPLYTYVADQKPGQTTGQKVKDAHGTWYVVFAQASKNPAPK